VNSTRIGNRLERAIFRLLKSEIDADRFFAKKGLCQIFQKKGYYSPDRKKDIVFDVSVEVYLPGAQQYSLLVLFECKNYSHPVPVDDIEEFFAKVQQVAAANSKAVVASKSSFQSGALEFAKSKHMGLLRYFGPENFKWELLRSPSATSSGLRPDAESMVIDGLTRPDFKSEVFDLFFQTPTRATTSLANFFDDLVVGTTLSDNEVRKIANPKSRQTHTVPFREKGDLEDLAEQTLESILYSSGPVALEAICKREADAVGLSVRAGLPLLAPERSVPPLGRIQFEPLIIDLYNQDVHHLGRDRFTLAHELAHHLLGHGAYSAHCDRRFRPNVTGHSDGSALGGFLTPIGHVASTFSPFPGFSIFVHGVTRRAACRDSGRSSWRSMRADPGDDIEARRNPFLQSCAPGFGALGA
jgi:Restriction endonuclease/IrrE N-terminal-like domain